MTQPTNRPPQVIHSPTGERPTTLPADWQPEQWPEVTKIVIGSLPSSDEEKTKSAARLDALTPWGLNLSRLGADFPKLTHLYLWRVSGLKHLNGLPKTLQCLDARACPDLETIEALPCEDLDTLVLEDNAKLSTLSSPTGDERVEWVSLQDLSLKGCTGIPQPWIQQLLTRAPALRKLDLSGCSQLEALADDLDSGWPDALVDIRLDGCTRLSALPSPLPPMLRRLDLRHAGIAALPSFPKELDYIDLRDTLSLRKLPDIHGTPRTLLIHGSRLEISPELFGEKADANMAPEILAHLDSLKQGTAYDHEVKVILLGNGRCGKSSLARRLIDHGFDSREESTHGIRLWPRKPWPFHPVDEEDPGHEEEALLNFWDFAGQDLYHNTHRLFLQSKAIFLICGTDHGDGHSIETDPTDDDGLAEGEDFRRGPLYWIEQVESLGAMPGTSEPPPILLVRTKTDRDGEPGFTPGWWAQVDSEVGPQPDLKRVDFSASDGAGTEKLEAWLSTAVSQVLGPKGRREIGASALEVKKAIQRKKDPNDAAHQESEETGRYVPPPEPTLALRDFQALVEDHCAGENYAETPGLLLERFHLSGFLYHHSRYLPEDIILDQRWVVNGIYGLLDREKGSWKRLADAEGRFTLEDLGEWAWNPRQLPDGRKFPGFPPEVQATFLQFMEACGICFELIPSHYRDAGRGTIYLAPAGLPDRSGVASRILAQRGKVAQRKAESISGKGVSQETMVQLLVRLGRDWRRAATLWKWGAQVESYRAEVWSDQRTFIHLEWEPEAEGGYGGTITLTQFGPDESFLHAILNECLELPGLEDARFSRQPAKYSGRQPALLEAEVTSETGEIAEDPLTVPAHKPDTEGGIGIEIGISFKGDLSEQESRVEDWHLLPDSSLEKWPRALAKALQFYRFTVREYRNEQAKMEHEKITDRKSFLDHLTSRDFMIAFLSHAYLQSPYCMYELMQIYNRMKGGPLDPAIACLWKFPDVKFSQSPPPADPATGGPPPKSYHALLREFWEEKLTEHHRSISQDARTNYAEDYHALQKEAATIAYEEWMAFVHDSSRFDQFLAALRGNWNTLAVPPEPPTDAEIDEWSREIVANTGRSEVLFGYARQAWRNANREGVSVKERKAERSRALDLFLKAIRKAPDFKESELENILNREYDDPDLDDIRRAARERELRQG